jgi:internalin A
MPVTLEFDGEGTGSAARAVGVGEWSSVDSQALVDAGGEKLELNRAKGFRGTSVDFLAELPQLRELKLIDLKIEDVAGVNALPNLRRLTLSTYARTPIDFSNFALLEKCFFEWIRGSDSLFECRTLRDLYINRFPAESLEPLHRLNELHCLRLGNGAKASSVAGVERLAELRELGLYRMPKVADWKPLSRATELEVLEVETCKRLEAIDFLRPMRRLRELSLVNCGPIDSLAPLADAEALERFFFYESTNVRDGDLSGRDRG